MRIPSDSVQSFRNKSSTHSDSFRPLIPKDFVQFGAWRRWIIDLGIGIVPQNRLQEVPMAKRRLSMRKIKEILRLKWACQQSNRQISKSCRIAHSTVGEYLFRAQRAGLCWPLDPDLDDAALEKLLYPSSPYPKANPRMPDMAYLHRELKRKNVTP